MSLSPPARSRGWFRPNLRAPVRELADETITSWLLDIVLDGPARMLAFGVLGLEQATRFRAEARTMAAPSSGWRGNLLVVRTWLVLGATIFAAYSVWTD